MKFDFEFLFKLRLNELEKKMFSPITESYRKKKEIKIAFHLIALEDFIKYNRFL